MNLKPPDEAEQEALEWVAKHYGWDRLSNDGLRRVAWCALHYYAQRKSIDDVDLKDWMWAEVLAFAGITRRDYRKKPATADKPEETAGLLTRAEPETPAKE